MRLVEAVRLHEAIRAAIQAVVESPSQPQPNHVKRLKSINVEYAAVIEALEKGKAVKTAIPAVIAFEANSTDQCEAAEMHELYVVEIRREHGDDYAQFRAEAH